MKRILLAAAMLVLAISAFQKAEARTDVSIDFFYDNLGDDGSWIEVGAYGYCWQPSIAVGNSTWRPYSDGYWAYSDFGWTWISYEDFGWATYHYGRWIRLRGRGWVWVPGREWGPAWVSWRTGADYIGWAPLPPQRAGEHWDESPITARVDVDFDIGPACYNFIDVRYIGEPVLRERIFPADQNVTYITKTVNVTNITYNNSAVYSYGPDYNTVSRYSNRPVQRLSLHRETNVDPAAAAKSKSLMKIEGDKLVVAAPQQLEKPATKVAPKMVKEKIAEPTVERGWDPVGDQKAQAELKEKIRKQDPKLISPPTVRASDKAASGPAASITPPSAARRYETVAPPPPAPRVGPPTTPQTNPNGPGPDSIKPETGVEKRKHDRPGDIAPRRMEQPPSNNSRPARDERRKQKKNEPATSPSP